MARLECLPLEWRHTDDGTIETRAMARTHVIDRFGESAVVKADGGSFGVHECASIEQAKAEVERRVVWYASTFVTAETSYATCLLWFALGMASAITGTVLAEPWSIK